MEGETKKIFQPSTFETVDYATFNWLQDEMNIHCTTNKGWVKVDTTWVTGERAIQSKEIKELRDSEGTLVLPRITMERISDVKDPQFKGIVQAHLAKVPDYKGGTYGAFRQISQKKTSNFANAQSYRSKKRQINFKTKKKHPTVYTTTTMPLPTYVTMTYKVIVRGEYQQQANEILQPFLTHAGQVRRFFVEHEGHRFEAFFEEDFTKENNVAGLDEEERIYKSNFNIKVLGYLMGGGKNEEYPSFTKRENAVEFKQTRERVVTEDEIESDVDFRLYRS